MSAVFGFSIACHRGDVPLLRGCLESIRRFAPDAPICLIADGQFSTRTLEKVYGVQVIRRDDVRDAGLKKWSFGYGFTKMVAFWETPFDIVFQLDADLVLWGDVRRNLPQGPWDVVYNEPHELITPEVLNGQYFDPRRIFRRIEPFPWEGNPYFNTGAMCVRRGSLDLDEYLRMMELQRKYPEDFTPGEGGMLNILVFRAVHAGRLVAKEAHLQTVVPCVSRADLERQFVVRDQAPVVERPTIVHWAGPKPWRRTQQVYSVPMDFFRAQAMRRCGLPSAIPTAPAMMADEYLSRDVPKFIAKTKKSLKRLMGRSV